MGYQYVVSQNRYRDLQTGRWVRREKVLAYSDQMVATGEAAGASVADLYTSGSITADEFGMMLKQELKSSYIQQGVLGRGGRAMMEPADWGWTGNRLRGEYRLINNFITELEFLSDAQIRARAALYFGGSRNAFERMNARSHGVDLPAYPGDGTTMCKNGCRCAWRIEKVEKNDYDCYWDTSSGETCPTCIQRGRSWFPLQVRNGGLLPYEEIVADE